MAIGPLAIANAPSVDQSVSRRKVPYKLNEIGLVAASLSRDLWWNRRIRAAFDIGLSQSRVAWERTMRLKGEVAVITGAGTGIGEAIAFKFAREGASVIVAGLPTDPVDDVSRRIERDGGRAVAFQSDLAEEVNANACVKAAIDAFGKLDILINNAGVLERGRYSPEMSGGGPAGALVSPARLVYIAPVGMPAATERWLSG
jgi:hypothetical protein